MNLKKLMAVVLATAVVFAMTACSGETETNPETEGGNTEIVEPTKEPEKQVETATGSAYYQNLSGDQFNLEFTYDPAVTTADDMVECVFTSNGGGKLWFGGLSRMDPATTAAQYIEELKDFQQQAGSTLVNDGRTITADFHGVELYYFTYTNASSMQANPDALQFDATFHLPEGNLVFFSGEVNDHSADIVAVLNDVILSVKYAEPEFYN